MNPGWYLEMYCGAALAYRGGLAFLRWERQSRYNHMISDAMVAYEARKKVYELTALTKELHETNAKLRRQVFEQRERLKAIKDRVGGGEWVRDVRKRVEIDPMTGEKMVIESGIAEDGREVHRLIQTGIDSYYHQARYPQNPYAHDAMRMIEARRKRRA